MRKRWRARRTGPSLDRLIAVTSFQPAAALLPAKPLRLRRSAAQRALCTVAIVCTAASALAQTTVSIPTIMTNLPNSPLLGQNVTTSGIVVGVVDSGVPGRDGGFYMSLNTYDNDATAAKGIFVAASAIAGCQVAVGQVASVTGVVTNSTAPNLTAADTPGTYLVPSACSASGTDATSATIDLHGVLASFGDALKYTGMSVSNSTFYAVGPTTGAVASSTATAVTSTGQFWATLNSNAATGNHLFRSTGIAVDENTPGTAPGNVPTWSGNPQRVLLDTTTFGGLPVDVAVGQTVTCTNSNTTGVGALAGVGLVDYTLGYARILVFKSVSCAVSGPVSTSVNAPADGTHFRVGTLDVNTFLGSASLFPTALAKATLAVTQVFGSPDILALQQVGDASTLQVLADAANTANGGSTGYVAYVAGTDVINSGYLVNTRTLQNVAVNEFGRGKTYTTTAGVTETLWEHPPVVLTGEFARTGKNYPLTVINVDFLPRDGSGDATLGADIRTHRAAQAAAISQMVQQLQLGGENVMVAGNFNSYEYNDGYVDVVGVVKGSPAAPSAVTTYQATSTIDLLTDFTTQVDAATRYNVIEQGNAASLEHILASSTVTNAAAAAAPLASYVDTVKQPHFSTDDAATNANDPTTPAGLTPHDGFLVSFAIPQVPTTAALAPGTLHFDETEVNGGKETLLLTFTNTTSFAATVNVLKIAVSGPNAPEFTEMDNCAALAQGASCTIHVTFAPLAAGTRAAVLAVTSDSSSEPTLTASLTGNGIDTSATLTPTTYSFPDTDIGAESGAAVFAFTNTSKLAALTLQVPSVTGDYAIASNSCTGTVAMGAACTIAVVFRPTAKGTRNGALTVANTSSGDPMRSVALTGTGLDTTVTLTPVLYAFPTTSVATASAAKVFTLANTSAVSLMVGAPTVTGDYALASNRCTTALAAGATCSIGVVFQPTVAGTRTGTLTVPNSSTGNAVLAASLTGTGVETTARLTPTSAAFAGTYAGGGVSAAQTFTFTNTSSQGISFSTAAVTSNFTLLNNTCAPTVAAGASCTLQVAFVPTTAGALTGTLTVTDGSSANGILTAALNGTGLPTTATLTPPAQTFGNVVLGTASGALNFGYTNTSAIPLTVTAANATGDYRVVSNGCSTVAAGASCAIGVVLTPTGLGQRTGTLAVSSSASATPTLLAALTGRGVADLEANTTSLDFGTDDVGSHSGAQVVTITNYTSAGINLTGLTLTGDYADTTTCQGTLPGLASCTVTLVFTPTAIGVRPGTLTVTTSDVRVSRIGFALTGSGTDFSIAVLPGSGSMIAGNGTMTATATLTALGGFYAPVSLTCSVEAVASTCTLPNPSFTLSATTTQNMDVTTTGQYTLVGYGLFGTKQAALLLGILSGYVAGLLFAVRRRCRLPMRLLLAAATLVLASCGGMSGCSSKYPSQHSSYTEPGSYVYTVTATDGTIQHSATYTLTVRQRN